MCVCTMEAGCLRGGTKLVSCDLIREQQPSMAAIDVGTVGEQQLKQAEQAKLLVGSNLVPKQLCTCGGENSLVNSLLHFCSKCQILALQSDCFIGGTQTQHFLCYIGTGMEVYLSNVTSSQFGTKVE